MRDALSMTTVVPQRKFLVDGLHEALPHLQRALAGAGRGAQFIRCLQAIVLQEADEATLERILSAVKREIGEIECVESEHGPTRCQTAGKGCDPATTG